MTWQEVLAGNAVSGTILLLAACAASLCLRRSSAAVRHFLWAAALTGLLVLPFAQRLAPRWGWGLPPALATSAAAIAASPSGSSITVLAPAPRAIPWLLIAWVLGAAVSGGWFLLGAGRVRRIRRASLPANFGPETPFRIRLSERAPVPMVCGIWRETIVLPAAARDWPAARLHAVLLHETEHIRRNDLRIQFLGQIACCLYWFQPLAWLALKRLSIERERACDDAVLAGGIQATDYATHLMELARSLGGGSLWVPAMAESSGLEGRVRELLDDNRSRSPLSRRAAVAITTVLVLFLVPLAMRRAQAQQPPSATPAGPIVLAGVVTDATGARVPGSEVTARSVDGPGFNQLTTHTDAVGIYRFAALPAGRYAVQFEFRGFAATTREVTLAAGQAAELDVTLAVGSVQESVTVKGQRPGTQANGVLSAGSQPRIRVGGNVQAARLFKQTRPVYPPELQQQGVLGPVVIQASISVTGEPVNLEVVSPGSDPRLAQAALDAVRQWRYQPALLNGEPVQVDTKITVDFRLDP